MTSAAAKREGWEVLQGTSCFDDPGDLTFVAERHTGVPRMKPHTVQTNSR